MCWGNMQLSSLQAAAGTATDSQELMSVVTRQELLQRIEAESWFYVCFSCTLSYHVVLPGAVEYSQVQFKNVALRYLL